MVPRRTLEGIFATFIPFRDLIRARRQAYRYQRLASKAEAKFPAIIYKVSLTGQAANDRF